MDIGKGETDQFTIDEYRHENIDVWQVGSGTARRIGIVVEHDIARRVIIEGGKDFGEIQIGKHGDADGRGKAENLALFGYHGHTQIGRFVDEYGVARALYGVAHFLWYGFEPLDEHFQGDRIGAHFLFRHHTSPSSMR